MLELIQFILSALGTALISFIGPAFAIASIVITNIAGATVIVGQTLPVLIVH